MPYGSIFSDTVQSSVASTAPVFRDGNSVEIGRLTKSWIDYNTATSTTRASFNVSSVTKNGTGQMTAYFTTAFSDSYYSCPSGWNRTDNTSGGYGMATLTCQRNATNVYILHLFYNGTYYDADYLSFSIVK